ncbi:ABC transporter permease [Streptomyces sp. MST-110588]|uniref:ABC transporter permease n=1 Tax=Streptomyces sp. MST-110588 TaxID=2833628 RepID=UPI001F5E3122|nr:ABC transporter permease [Streptomyces sp. MST-110588]UNO39435.1 ABC transporter permease [Streptomyces sp. MST-110588]
MFVAWRDLRFAKGRFALMGTVIVLITVLVGLLSGLTAGLGRENTSALTGLPVGHLAFAAPAQGADVSFTDSRVQEKTWRAWARVPGVQAAEPLGITTVKAEAAGDAKAETEAGAGTRAGAGSQAGRGTGAGTEPKDGAGSKDGAGPGPRTAALSAFGVRPGSGLAPTGTKVADGSAVLSVKAADKLGVRPGDTLTLAGRRLRAAAISGSAMYSHTPVIWTSLQDWQHLAGSGGPDTATVIALRTAPGASSGASGTAALAAADRKLGTRTVTTEDALKAIGSFTAENGSLQLMRGFLFAISALVIGAFFTVWTIQRGGDVAVLKALGASTRYLLRDALGQAVLLLVAGTGLGTAIAASVGAVVGGTVPFVLEPATVLIPALIMIALGAAGAALSIRRITSVDPLTALGSAR